MQIKGKLLDKLRCDFCAEPLSYSPILINNEGRNMCGRCITSKENDESFVLNQVYEEVAAYAQFPCIYTKNGCSATVQLENSKYHEENCPYRIISENNPKSIFTCPFSITNNCTWIGQRDEFDSHCKNEHNYSIINQPSSYKPFLNKSSERNFIIKFFDYLFLLQVSCILPTNMLWHNAQFLGPSNLAHLFEYYLEFKNGKCSLVENKNIKPYNPNTDIESSGTRNKITNLINLLGPYDEIKVNLSINIKKISCLRCKDVIRTAPLCQSDEEGKFYCATCYEINSLFAINYTLTTDSPKKQVANEKSKQETPSTSKTGPSTSKNDPSTSTTETEAKRKEQIEKLAAMLTDFCEKLDKKAAGPSGIGNNTVSQEDPNFYGCSNQMYGCKFATTSQELHDRHENWLCNAGPLCYLCFENYHPETKFQHLLSDHVDGIASATMLPGSCDRISKLYTITLDMEDCEIAIIDCHDRTFIAVFEFSVEKNIFFIVTNENPENICFTFKYRIASTDRKTEIYGDLTRIKNNNEPMYWLNDFPKFDDPNNEFQFSLTVKKWDVE